MFKNISRIFVMLKDIKACKMSLLQSSMQKGGDGGDSVCHQKDKLSQV